MALLWESMPANVKNGVVALEAVDVFDGVLGESMPKKVKNGVDALEVVDAFDPTRPQPGVNCPSLQ